MIDLKSIDINKISGFFRKKPQRVGVEVEGGKARLVRIVKNGVDGYLISGFAEIDFELDSFSIAEKEAFHVQMLRLAYGVQHVAVNIEDQSLRLRRMVFPKMPDQDMQEAIKWNFREHIEVPIEDYLAGCLPLSGGVEGNKVAVVAYGVSRHATDRYLLRFKSLGFKVAALEPVASALHMSFYTCGMLQDDKCHSCMAFGNKMTHFVIFRGRELLFSRPLSQINRDGVVRQIMRDANLIEGVVQDMMSNWIAGKEPGTGLELSIDVIGKFHATVKHFMSQMVIEIQRSIDAFSILYGLEKVDSLHVAGQGSFYPGLVEHVQKSLGIKTEVFNPFLSLLDKTSVTEEVLKLGPLYAVATGLAMP